METSIPNFFTKAVEKKEQDKETRKDLLARIDRFMMEGTK